MLKYLILIQKKLELIWLTTPNLKQKLKNMRDIEIISIALQDAEKLIDKEILEPTEGQTELNDNQKSCIIQMVYQLGGPRTSKFKKMWQALREGDALTASAEIIDSRWHAQTPGRCEEVAAEMSGSSI